MEQSYISFNTAKLAKACGFDYDYTQFYYADDSLLHESSTTMSNSYDNVCIAVQQSVLQKWLREQCDIDIVIHRSFAVNYGYHYCIVVNHDYDNENLQEVEAGRSYETALEDALYAALHIVKDDMITVQVPKDLLQDVCKYCEDQAIYDKLSKYNDFYYKIKQLLK